jgi:NodT family efflux transporter outer membrane factor (OMF) lipoprotein
MKRLVLALLLPCVAACSVHAPPRTEPDIGVETPDGWTASEVDALEPDSDWWTTFDDPHLTRLIEIALEQNNDLQAAAARLARAEAEARIAGADLEPSAGARLDGSRQRQNFVGFPIPGEDVLSTTSTRVGVSLDASWEIDLWGRIRARARAAVADVQAAEADLRGARLSIAAQTARVWFAIQEALQQVELAESSAESFEESSENIRARYKQGVRSPLDLRLALSNVTGARASLERRRSVLDSALRQLEVLMGDYPAADLLSDFPTEAPPPMPPPVPAGLPAELVARRPDLVAAERRLASADQRWLEARRSLYPRLSLTAGGGTSSDSLSDLLDGDFRVWGLVANLTQPIFQGGRLRAGIDRAEALTDEALASYAAFVLRAFAEVETALAAESFLADEETQVALNVGHLVAAERLAEDRYRLGVGGYLAVLESQTRSFLVRSELLAVRRQRLDNRVDLHLALGGGFESPAGPQVVTTAAAGEAAQGEAP